MAPNTPYRKTDHYTASHPDDLPQAADYTVHQPLHLYTEQDHQTWRTLYARQAQCSTVVHAMSIYAACNNCA